MFGARRSYEERSTVSAAKEGTNESHDDGIDLFFVLVFLKEGGGGEKKGGGTGEGFDDIREG